MFTRILYPTDFGEYAWPNLACILEGLPTCREVSVVHVVDVETLQHNLLPAYLAEDEARIRALAERELDRWAQDLKGRGVEAREGVLRGAQCPVLVTKYPAAAEAGPEECARVCGRMFRRVLYATDWSDPAERALQLIREFPNLGTEEVLVLHVLDRAVLAHVLADQAAEYQRRDQERLEDVARRLRFHGLAVETRFRVGKVVEEIQREATTRGIHLVVMGYVGRSGWRNAIWGSTTERVVRHTDRAVLVVKGQRPGAG